MMNLPAHAADGSATQKTFTKKTLQFLEQLALLAMIIAPMCLAFYAAVALTQGGVSWKYPVAAFLLASFVNLGTTAGFHRMLTHQSFRAHPIAQYVLLILGAVAGMGSPVCWACNHIHHHSHSDTDNDIHSPHTHRFEGWRFETLRQWIDAHMGWILRYQADTVRVSAKARQVIDTPAARFVHKTAVVWFLAGLFLPLCLGWNAFLWLGLVRLFLNQHITYSVNSICHLWGRQPFPNTKDRSRNNALVGVLALGEGWHNNHHFRPASARHGLLPGQIDITYSVICLLERMGLASHVQRYAPCPQCRDWRLVDRDKGTPCARCRVAA